MDSVSYYLKLKRLVKDGFKHTVFNFWSKWHGYRDWPD